MGSGSSRLGSGQTRTRVNRRSKLLPSLFCGCSSSRTAAVEMEEYSDKDEVSSSECHHPLINTAQNPPVSPLISSTGTQFDSVTGASSASSTAVSDSTYAEDGRKNSGPDNHGKGLADSKELVPPSLVSADSSPNEYYRDGSSTTASTSFKDQESSEPVSVNNSANKNAVNGIENPAEGVSQIGPEPSCSYSQSLEDSGSAGVSVETHESEVIPVHNSHSDPVSLASDLPVAFHSLGEESIRGVLPAGLGFLMSNRDQDRVDGNVVHVDVVTISSNILSRGNADTDNREARRNSRRMFRDAFSRRSSRRLTDSPTIVFSTDDTGDLGSHDRWLLDFSGDYFDDGVGGDSGYLGRRVHSLNERRRHSRSEIWERLRAGLDENSRRTTFCPSGLHPDGTCSCESFVMSEDSGTRAISRIVMLAEALFEVLDEIHRQPGSLSLSMVSLPAPESLVDSFPIKSHKKGDKAGGGDEPDQCYICLAEYEEGDRIRLLPCHHEYHMSCVDKWLKEIHGVCPLCRGDVRQGATESSNSEIPSV